MVIAITTAWWMGVPHHCEITFSWMLWREAICWHIFHLAKPSMHLESWNCTYTTSKQSQVFACVNTKSLVLIHTWADGFVKFLFMLERGVSLLHSHVGLPLGAPLAGDYLSIEPPSPPGSNHPQLCYVPCILCPWPMIWSSSKFLPMSSIHSIHQSNFSYKKTLRNPSPWSPSSARGWPVV
jgi:hypothetical protein